MHKHGLAIPKSTKCHYYYHDAMQLKDRGWNDGKFLADEMAYKCLCETPIGAGAERAEPEAWRLDTLAPQDEVEVVQRLRCML